MAVRADPNSAAAREALAEAERPSPAPR
jgi:hypothetical protein